MAVGYLSKNLVRSMQGKRLAKEEKLAPYLEEGGLGTPNQRYMAAACALFAEDEAIVKAGIAAAGRMLSREEAEGPRPWELLCPDYHEGMYLLARVGIIAAGVNSGDRDLVALGERAADILGQELRLADLVASPDGDCRGLPGMRAPAGAGIARRALSHLWIEVRRRQPKGENLVHYGPGGRLINFKWTGQPNARLVETPAWWMRLLLDADPPADLMLRLSPAVSLPKRLRLPLTVHRWNGGTLAYLADPGPKLRGQFVVHGSAAAKRDKDRDEDPVTWVRVEWGKPGKHRVTAGESWQTEPPEPPAGAKTTRI